MKELHLLVVSLCVLGPICVHGYVHWTVDSIIYDSYLYCHQVELAKWALGEDDFAGKCAQAKKDAKSTGVKWLKARKPKELPEAGAFQISGADGLVVGYKIHDNPIVVLSTDLQVYVQKHQ